MRFDSKANLEGWLKSDARAALVQESEELVQGFHAQRIDTSFPGWVPTDPATGKPPSKWKTACLILLTLFPLVMLEIRFLNPHLQSLNPAVGTFIGNASDRCADHLAADAACHLGLPCLAIPGKAAALAGDDDAHRAGDMLPHRDRRPLASALRRALARSDGASTSVKMLVDAVGTSMTQSECRAMQLLRANVAGESHHLGEIAAAPEDWVALSSVAHGRANGVGAGESGHQGVQEPALNLWHVAEQDQCAIAVRRQCTKAGL